MNAYIFRYLYHYLAIISGIIAIFAFSPYNFIPAFIVSIVALIFIIDKCENWKCACLMGFLWGIGFFIAGLHWFAYALMIDFQRLFWLIPFAATILQAVLALYIALFGFLCSIKFKNDFIRIYFLACSWTVIEWLRGNLLTGFPWIISGYVFSETDEISQAASVTGIYGLSLVIIVIALAFYLLFKLRNKASLVNLIVIIAVTLAIQLWGAKRIADHDLKEIKMPKVLVVQSGILAHLPSRKEGISTFYTHLDMTKQSYNNEDIIIWPESSHPFLVRKEQETFASLFSFINKDSKVVLGSPSITFDTKNNSYYWNSMLIINANGEIVNHYDKMHLVPFGEYVPLQKYLPPIKIITENFVKGYSAQDKMHNIKAGEFLFRPLICYEAIFSDHPQDSTSEANFIINITNDNWYGDSLGPYQHFSMTKYRAIEQGIPLVRVAISGISAIFDSYGRIIHKIELSQKGMISAILPAPLKSTPIYSARIEYFMIFILAVISLLFLRIRNKDFHCG